MTETAAGVAGATETSSLLQRIGWVWVLIAWTIFLWASRLRNVLGNEELSAGAQAIRVGVVVIFVGLALVVAASRAISRVSMRVPWVLPVFLLWTVGYWLVRGIGILIDGEYSVGFKAVHTVLMVVSVTLSVLAARQMRRGR